MTLTPHRTTPAEAGGHDGSFADMVERLFREFDRHLTLPQIVGVVRESREQLRGSPRGALPELTERLAYHRLTELVPPAGDAGPPSGRTVHRKGSTMSALDKAKDKLEEMTGKAKEAVGERTDNPDLATEGRADQTEANLKQAGEKVKDVFKD
jgi:uncharacterized protein YjbJ (UPF0337 family)